MLKAEQGMGMLTDSLTLSEMSKDQIETIEVAERIVSSLQTLVKWEANVHLY